MQDLGDLCQPGWCPLWTIRAGAVILHRSGPDDDSIVTALNGGESPSFGWSGGPDVSILRDLSNCDSVELRYFGALDWEIDESLIAGPVSLGALYNSRLHSTEVNWRRQKSECVTWLAGFRWIELHEELGFSVVVPTDSVDIDTNIDNHLYGGQIGAELALLKHCSPWSIDGFIKAGVYGNAADNELGVVVNGTPVADLTTSETDVAFVGEIGVTATYRLSECWAVRGGYELLWIDGVALADEQFGGTIDTSGDVFYHGATAGLEFTW